MTRAEAELAEIRGWRLGIHGHGHHAPLCEAGFALAFTVGDTRTWPLRHPEDLAAFEKGPAPHRASGIAARWLYGHGRGWPEKAALAGLI
jgi:hypothetical protein